MKELPDIYDRRLAACSKLESAETSLLKTATKLRLKAVQTSAKNGTTAADVEVAANQESITQVPESERPTHKLGFLGLFGEKVDSINWAREEIVKCTQLLEQGREKLRDHDHDEEQGPSLPTLTSAVDDEELGISTVYEDGIKDSSSVKKKIPVTTDVPSQGASGGATKTAAEVPKETVVESGSGGKDAEYPPMNSAFVTFERQVSAHLAVQVLAHHEPYRMS